MCLMENPYELSKDALPPLPPKPPFRERFAVGVMFAVCTIPLLSIVIVKFMEYLPRSDEPISYRIVGPGGVDLLQPLLMSLLLFAAGIALMLRRRMAVWLFATYILVLAVTHLVMGWSTDRLIGTTIIAVFLAYALALRKRGRLS
jgi:hypothetical protein